ncbi:hypothetical protein NQZ68_003209 [Dissostichus eleginoides]|nr:hypothetical protein NQZ68_003209 [Dissostichus eleginoides]
MGLMHDKWIGFKEPGFALRCLSRLELELLGSRSRTQPCSYDTFLSLLVSCCVCAGTWQNLPSIRLPYLPPYLPPTSIHHHSSSQSASHTAPSPREMVWEGDRLFCFLQQSKLETCGSPDKLSRVGELAGLITGRAKTG